MRKINMMVAGLMAGAAVIGVSPAAAICMGDGEYEQALADIEAREATSSRLASEAADQVAATALVPEDHAMREIEVAKIQAREAGAN